MSRTEIQPGVCYRDDWTVAAYEEAIADLTAARDQRASMERGEYQPGCAVCGDGGHTVNGCHHDPLRLARQRTESLKIWQCWHCGFEARTDDEAREHFGVSEDEIARCLKERANDLRHDSPSGKITMTELAARGLDDRAIIKLVENGVIKDYGDLPGDRTGEPLTRKEMEAFGLGPICDCGERGLSPEEDECRMCGDEGNKEEDGEAEFAVETMAQGKDLSEIFQEGIAQILRDVLGTQGARFNPQTRFSDLKTDSLELVQIQVSIEEKYSIEIPDDALSPDITLAQLADLVRETAA